MRIKSIILLSLAAFMAFISFSCLSTTETARDTTRETNIVATDNAGESTPGMDADQEASSDEMPRKAADEAVAELNILFQDGLDKLELGLISDAIKQFVSILALKQESEPSGEIDQIALKAESELISLENAMSLDVDPQWLDSNMNQKKGSTMDLSLAPMVILTLRSETGRFLISNAPVAFQFVKGGGTLSGTASTNEYGQASCAIGRFDDQQSENIIQASVFFRARSLTYAFQGISRDFVYVPPSRTAIILVLERSVDGISENSFIMNAVYKRLKDLAFDLSHLDGRLSPPDFMKVYGGDSETIGRMGLAEGVSYIVVVLNDCNSVRQLEMGGKKLNLFVSDARATTRIIRVADGKIMYQVSVERAKDSGTHGQGNSKQIAITDVLKETSLDMADALERDFLKISRIMTGGTE